MRVAPILGPILTVAVLCAGAAALAQAESAEVSFGMQQDTSLPVEVTSEQLSVDQSRGTAVFTGNVVVTQGEMRLAAPRLEVDYSQGADGRIERAHATGGVTLVNAREAAEAEEAVYTVGTGSILMTGEVLLTQGRTTLSGSRLTIDLDTGSGQMQGPVRTVFQTDGQ